MGVVVGLGAASRRSPNQGESSTALLTIVEVFKKVRRFMASSIIRLSS
jgi:hypothetical protein